MEQGWWWWWWWGVSRVVSIPLNHPFKNQKILRLDFISTSRGQESDWCTLNILLPFCLYSLEGGEWIITSNVYDLQTFFLLVHHWLFFLSHVWLWLNSQCSGIHYLWCCFHRQSCNSNSPNGITLTAPPKPHWMFGSCQSLSLPSSKSRIVPGQQRSLFQSNE